ncbi:MAG: HAMP domain-containing protein, partial [Methylocystaceae bacterium]
MYRKIKFLFNISWRITLVYALMFSLVLFVLSTGLLYGIRFYFLYQAEQQVAAVESSVEHMVLTSPENRRLTDLNDRLLENVPTADNISVYVLNAKRQIMVPQRPGSQEKAVQRLLEESLKEHNINGSVKYLEVHDHHFIYISQKLSTQNHEIIYLQVVKDLHNVYEFLTILLIMLAIFDFLGIMVSLIIGHAVSRRTLHPVDAITSTAENISAYDLSQRIQVSGPEDELTRLARTLNNMID